MIPTNTPQVVVEARKLCFDLKDLYQRDPSAENISKTWEDSCAKIEALQAKLKPHLVRTQCIIDGAMSIAERLHSCELWSYRVRRLDDTRLVTLYAHLTLLHAQLRLAAQNGYDAARFMELTIQPS